jgi:hypothetical protein
MGLTAGQRMELCGVELQLRELPAGDPSAAALQKRAEQLRAQDTPRPGAAARPPPSGVTLVPGPDGAAVPATHERGADGSLRPLGEAGSGAGEEPAGSGSGSGSSDDDSDDDEEEEEDSGDDDDGDADWDAPKGRPPPGGKPTKGQGRAAPKAKAKAIGPKQVAAGIEAVLEDGSDPYAPDGGADTKDDPQASAPLCACVCVCCVQPLLPPCLPASVPPCLPASLPPCLPASLPPCRLPACS